MRSIPCITVLICFNKFSFDFSVLQMLLEIQTHNQHHVFPGRGVRVVYVAIR